VKIGLQQGEADGLCGMYAAMAFLAGTKQWRGEDPSNALWYLLDAARHFGWFTPYHLTKGFEAHEIKAILEREFDHYRMPYEAFYMDDVARQLKTKDYHDITFRVLAKDGSVITGPDGHWILITTRDGSPKVIDSANRQQPEKPFSRRFKSLRFADAIIILPKPRPTISVDI
jgi:hypothetical protein